MLLVGWAVLFAACDPPPRAACDAHPPAGELGSVCGFDHPEDLEVVRSAGLVLATGMRPGAGLFAVEVAALDDPVPRPWRIWPDAALPGGGLPPRGDRACPGPPDPDAFFSHGLGLQSSAAGEPVHVAVVNHGGRESVELFDLVGAGREARMRWRGCVPFVAGQMANDVAIAPDGELVVSNFIPDGPGIVQFANMKGMAFGLTTGDVYAWRGERGWSVVPGTRARGPNGLTLSPDGERIFYAENGAGNVIRVPRAGIAEGVDREAADVGWAVDNVTWAEGGRILGILHVGGIASLVQSCLLDWAITEIDPDALTSRVLLVHHGDVLCDATSAIRVGDVILVGSMSETRIGLLRGVPAR